MAILITKEEFQMLCSGYERRTGVAPLLRRRHRANVVSRQVISLILRKRYGACFREIGELLICDHSTAIHGANKAEDMINLGTGDFIESLESWQMCISEVIDTGTVSYVADRVEELMTSCLKEFDTTETVIASIASMILTSKIVTHD